MDIFTEIYEYNIFSDVSTLWKYYFYRVYIWNKITFFHAQIFYSCNLSKSICIFSMFAQEIIDFNTVNNIFYVSLKKDGF